MQHSCWLKLRQEGCAIAIAFHEKGWRVNKFKRCLTWQISKDRETFSLTWLPSPVSDWAILPNRNGSAVREEASAIVSNVIGRGTGR